MSLLQPAIGRRLLVGVTVRSTMQRAATSRKDCACVGRASANPQLGTTLYGKVGDDDYANCKFVKDYTGSSRIASDSYEEDTFASFDGEEHKDHFGPLLSTDVDDMLCSFDGDDFIALPNAAIEQEAKARPHAPLKPEPCDKEAKSK